jgi:signal transduction histidine kinase
LTPEDVAVLPQLGFSLQGYVLLFGSLQAFAAYVLFGLGIFVFVQRGDQFGPYLLSLMLVTFGLIGSVLTSPLYQAGPFWASLLRSLQAVGLAAVVLSTLVFPDGQFKPGWIRWLALAWVAYVMATVFVPSLRITPSVVFATGRQTVLYSWGLAWIVILAGVQMYRYRVISTPVQREQTRWVIWGWVVVSGLIVMIGVSLIVLTRMALPRTALLASRIIASSAIVWGCVLLGACYAIAILRHRLFDIDVVLNRTLVYAGVTATIVAVYAVIVGGFGALLNTQGNPVVAFGAACVVAALFQPLRGRMQRGVNRLMYGQRDEPYAVLARFGRQLETTPALDTLLPTIVSTIKDTLKLPHVAIEFAGEAPSEHAQVRFPLKHQGQSIGHLIVAPRQGESELSATDRRLLEDLARQAEVAIHAASVTADLQRARERLVVAREEERRRIRNDLHDGLAPTLSSLQLQLGAMRNLIRQDPDQAEASANELREDLRAATAEVRRLVYNLRPPALDDLGLLGAIRSQAQKVSQQDGLSVSVNAPDLPSLPAAVEVAAYRIAHEALMNVVRHARARRCVITLTPRDDDLILEIRDDGRGMAPDAQAGIGLSSMRERAIELGGEFAVSLPADGGTIVCAHLPLKIKTWTSSAS